MLDNDARAADIRDCEEPAEAMRPVEDGDEISVLTAIWAAHLDDRPTLPEESTAELAIIPEDDGEVRALVDKSTGEIIELPDAPKFPSGAAITKEAVDYYTGRRLRAMGRIAAGYAAHAAKVAFWIRVIDEEYMSKIKRDEGLVTFLDGQYKDAFEALANASLAKGKRSVNINGLTAKFSTITSGGGLDVAEPEKAIDWLETYHPETVKREVMKTKVIEAVGKGYAFPDGSGLDWAEVTKTEVFKVEAG